MKVLVSTHTSQGNRSNDFCHVPEGEIVTFGSECDGESVDGGCGCRRAMVGTKCLTATTTMKVDNLPMTFNDLVQRIRTSLKKGGWTMRMEKDEAERWARETAEDLERIANTFPVGTLIEKRGNFFQKRNV